jgi:hypothetical protein
MRYTTREIRIPIAQAKAFTSSGAVKGEWLNPEKTILGIYSYQTLMAVILKETGKALVNRNRYSVTTSKHQSNIRLGISKGEYQTEHLTADEIAERLKATNAEPRAYQWATPIGLHK